EGNEGTDEQTSSLETAAVKEGKPELSKKVYPDKAGGAVNNNSEMKGSAITSQLLQPEFLKCLHRAQSRSSFQSQVAIQLGEHPKAYPWNLRRCGVRDAKLFQPLEGLYNLERDMGRELCELDSSPEHPQNRVKKAESECLKKE
ncbi:hypothetical protein U0070_006815, partial [Myodes glareolus]